MESKIKLFCLILLISLISCSYNSTIFDQKLSREDLEQRVKAFNDWYHNRNQRTNKLEVRLRDDDTLGVYATEDIKYEDVFLSVNRSNAISHDLIYNTAWGPILKEAEEEFGFDDYTNMVLFLVHEIGNPESQWKPYLDLLPRIPPTFSHDFFKRKMDFEPVILNFAALRKILDYKLLVGRKARSLFAYFVQNRTEEFDETLYSEKNLEWAMMILDSRIKYIDFEAFLIPMLDFIHFDENRINPGKYFKPTFTENSFVDFKSINNYKKDDQVFTKLPQNNEYFLIYHGEVVEDNEHDCYSLTLSFTEKQGDALSEKRKQFFQKFFLYDKNEFDLIEECLSITSPFSRRFLFFQYTLMIDEDELKKVDPKRIGLEQDVIILEYVKNWLEAQYQSLSSMNHDDFNRQGLHHTERTRVALKFRKEQLNYLKRIIELYGDQINRLVKEDAL